jgi:cyclopropane-fatty-acyl-phospholipid synthase
VTTVTLSKEQKRFAEDRLAKLPAEISSRIQILLCDYRRLPELFPNKRFDKIVSIEMIEAVGPEFLATYFQLCDRMLHPNHGIMAFQCITMPDSRYAGYKTGVDFIQRYIFPGGHCPSVSSLVQAVNEGSGGQLIVDDVENIGPHYARTLRVWREQFLANFDAQLKPLKKFTTRQKQLSSLVETVASWMPWANSADSQEQVPFYSEEFKRKWVYYLSYCEAGFATRTLGNVQMVLSRECNSQMLDGKEQIVL